VKYAEVQQAACAEDRPEKTAVRYTKPRQRTVAVTQRLVVFGLPEWIQLCLRSIGRAYLSMKYQCSRSSNMRAKDEKERS